MVDRQNIVMVRFVMLATSESSVLSYCHDDDNDDTE